MKKFRKLSRAEMKNVKGGVSQPGSCQNTCANDDDCPADKSTCVSTSCTDSTGQHTIYVCGAA